MSKKTIPFQLLCLLFFSQLAASNQPAQTNDARYYNERFVIKSLQTISAAQATYSAAGNGNYGSNLDLLEAEFIDAELAGGDKHGYYFMFFNFPSPPQRSARFYVTAIPQLYGKTGKLSFYIDEKSEIHGADKNGRPATATDPIIDPCAEDEYEKCVIMDLQTINSAEMTYQGTTGNGSFGTLNQLYKADLIGKSMSRGFNHGYRFTMTVSRPTLATPAFFKISATPEKYGANTVRSFYIDTDGNIRGADKHGKPADENDPFVD
ncbi:MAG TPA: hypothetical protein VF692_03885 [Pyrinomonadaceae bacterium]|jgi:hypothetical protein